MCDRVATINSNVALALNWPDQRYLPLDQAARHTRDSVLYYLTGSSQSPVNQNIAIKPITNWTGDGRETTLADLGGGTIQWVVMRYPLEGVNGTYFYSRPLQSVTLGVLDQWGKDNTPACSIYGVNGAIRVRLSFDPAGVNSQVEYLVYYDPMPFMGEETDWQLLPESFNPMVEKRTVIACRSDLLINRATLETPENPLSPNWMAAMSQAQQSDRLSLAEWEMLFNRHVNKPRGQEVPSMRPSQLRRPQRSSSYW